MPFLLPLIFLADLIAAALTFAAASSVSLWRRYAITAPVFVFIAAPMTAIFIYLLFAPAAGWAHLGNRYPTALVIVLSLAIGSLLTAYVASLTCRFVLQILAPRVEHLLDLRSLLIVQGAILSVGTLSLLVILFLFPNLARMIWVFGPHWISIVTILIGLVAVVACIFALLRLRSPEQYIPRPLPRFLAPRVLKVP